MDRRRDTRCRRAAGQALAEFAIIGTLLTLLSAGTFEYGRVLHTKFSVVHAAREGARVAMIDTSDANVRAAVKSAAERLGLADGNITITRSAVAPARITVRVTSDFDSPVPLVSNFWGGGTLEIEHTMVGRKD